MRLRPTPADARDKRYHFHRLFGTVDQLPTELDLDPHLTMPDQNADGRPEACTSYCVTDIATDQDRALYSHDFEFMKTLQVMGTLDPSHGADARIAFSVAPSIGLLPRSLEPSGMSRQGQNWAVNPANWSPSLDDQTVRKPAYIPVVRAAGQDWFDAVRNTLAQGYTVGLCTEWSPDFEYPSAFLTERPTRLYWGHMYKVTGVHTVGGELYLRLKTWQGSNRYDSGICYMSRTLCNVLMGTLGAYAATLAHLPSDVLDSARQQRVTILETLLALSKNLLMYLTNLPYAPR